MQRFLTANWIKRWRFSVNKTSIRAPMFAERQAIMPLKQTYFLKVDTFNPSKVLTVPNTLITGNNSKNIIA